MISNKYFDNVILPLHCTLHNRTLIIGVIMIYENIYIHLNCKQLRKFKFLYVLKITIDINNKVLTHSVTGYTIIIRVNVLTMSSS